ncbi:MAG: SprB repeat-containing protein, partial [Bacteroidetes bacterium]|nr:SprB repeat-containing protein [Bacteroidota bacterium]
VLFATTQLTSNEGSSFYTCVPYSRNSYQIYSMDSVNYNDTSATIFPARNFAKFTSWPGCNGPAENTLTAYDEAKRYRISFNIRSNDCDQDAVDILAFNYPVISYWSDFPTAQNGDTVIIQNPSGKFQRPDAILETNVQLPLSQNSVTGNIEMNIHVATKKYGYTYGDNDIFHQTAENAFLIFHSASGGLVIDSVVNTSRDSAIITAGNISNDSVWALGLIGNFWNYGDADVRTYAHYNCRDITGSDSVLVYSGWNCAGYPTDLTEVCFLDSQWVVFNVVKPGLMISMITDSVAEVCDTLHFSLTMQATIGGHIDDVVVKLPQPASGGYDFISGSASLTYNGVSTPVPNHFSSDTVVWKLSEDGFLSDFEIKIATLEFDIKPECGFFLGVDTVLAIVNAMNYCGQPLGPFVQADRPLLVTLPLRDSLTVEFGTDTLQFCGDTLEVDLIVSNVGDHATTRFNFAEITLPASCTWAGGEPIVSVSGQDYAFAVPADLLPGDTAVISFIVANSGSISGTIMAKALIPNSISCASDDSCFIGLPYIAGKDTLTIILKEIFATVEDIDPLCNGFCDGYISVINVDGISPYHYTWSNALPDSSAQTSLCAGDYSVSVTDAERCVVVRNISLSDPPAIGAFVQKTDITCHGGSDGSAEVVCAGQGPFEYMWNIGVTTPHIDSLTVGSYSITVSSGECFEVKYFSISEPPPVIIDFDFHSPLCFNGCDGSVTANVLDGTQPYSHIWVYNGISILPDTTASLDGLCAGVYTDTVTDANGCRAFNHFGMANFSNIKFDVLGENPLCFGDCNGEAMIDIDTSIFHTTLWSTNETIDTISGLCEGWYFATITDTNGCAKTDSIYLDAPDSIGASVSYTNVTCHGLNNGEATIS